MKRTAVIIATFTVLHLSGVAPVLSQSVPSDAYSDAVSVAQSNFNIADVAYNAALSVFNLADAVLKNAMIAKESARVARDAAYTEWKAADLDVWRLEFFPSPDPVVRPTANARLATALIAKDATAKAYGQASYPYSIADAQFLAYRDLRNKEAVRTLNYNKYVQAVAIAANNKTATTVPIIATTVPIIATGPNAITANTTSSISVRKYRNCAELQKVFPNGVAKDIKSVGKSGSIVNLKVYKANIAIDRDKDGVACERP